MDHPLPGSPEDELVALLAARPERGPRPDARDGHVPPRSEVEAVLAGIWGEVLSLEHPGVEDDFLRLGGESLAAAQVVGRVRDRLGVELSPRAPFEHPTIAALAGCVEAARAGITTPGIGVADGHRPLSFGQERLWFLDQLTPGRAEWNEAAAWTIRGDLDVAALGAALSELVRRHDVLRTRIVDEGGAARQEVEPAARVELREEDLSWLAPDERAEEARRLVEAAAAEPFDLTVAPPLRALVARVADDEWVLLLAIHHIACDAWSMQVLLGELAGLLGGRPLRAPRTRYVDYAAWQRERLRGPELERHLRYWRGRLAGMDGAELPADHPRPPVRTGRGARAPFAVRASTARALAALGRREGATPFMVLLAALQALLSRCTGQADVVVGSPVAGRPRTELEDVVGFFVNTLVLRTEVRGGESFRTLLRRVRETALGAYEHEALPFERLVEELRPERDLSRTPLFQVAFSLHGGREAGLSLDGLDVRPYEVDVGAARYDLELWLAEGPEGGLSGALTYSTDLFAAATARRLCEQLGRLLEACARHPDRPLETLALSSPAERARLDAWNRTAVAHPGGRVHELFEAQVGRTPDAVALVRGKERLTYRELERRANRLAWRLRERGVGPDAVVGVRLERSPELLIGLLGVLKAGGAYLPLDPDEPRERLEVMLAEARPAAVVTRSDLRDDGAARREGRPRSGVAERNLAYVLFTSGSTGAPKAAMLEHRGVVNWLRWMQAAHPMPEPPRVLQKTPFTFDVSVLELFWPLLAGGTVVMARPGGQRDPEHLVQLVEAERVNAVHFVPSMLPAFLEHAGDERCRSLRHVVCIGEVLGAALADRCLERLPAALHNQYGPTEASIAVSAWRCERHATRVPIGRPIANTRLHVLDARLEPVPVGIPGELYIGGVGLARGYLGRPGLTAERFVPDPRPVQSGDRLYRTGDRARWLDDGALEFLGRVDRQVKVRGHRIEPAEVEAALLRHPGIAEAAVVARDAGDGRPRLVAYLAAPGGAPDAGSLLRHLRERLPEPMVPSAFVELPALPRTSSGKLDQRALPDPRRERPSLEEPYAAPRGDVEAELSRIWAEVLDLDHVGVRDDFFALGGHSLLALQVHWRIRERLAPDLPFVAVFQHPTIAELAEVITPRRR